MFHLLKEVATWESLQISQLAPNHLEEDGKLHLVLKALLRLPHSMVGVYS